MCDSCGKSGCTCEPYPNKKMHEHDAIRSRTTGRKIEIDMGMHGDGLVPKNPFASQLQQRFLHAHPEKVGGTKKLKEWDNSTDFSNLPKRSKQAGNRKGKKK